MMDVKRCSDCSVIERALESGASVELKSMPNAEFNSSPPAAAAACSVSVSPKSAMEASGDKELAYEAVDEMRVFDGEGASGSTGSLGSMGGGGDAVRENTDDEEVVVVVVAAVVLEGKEAAAAAAAAVETFEVGGVRERRVGRTG